MYICARCVSVCGFDGFIHCTVCFKVLICVGLCVLNRYVSDVGPLISKVAAGSVEPAMGFVIIVFINRFMIVGRVLIARDLLVGGSQTTRNGCLYFVLLVCVVSQRCYALNFGFVRVFYILVGVYVCVELGVPVNCTLLPDNFGLCHLVWW
eukprot:gene13118-8964_t